MRIQSGRDYDTFTWNDTTYLGKYQIVPGRLADGHPPAVTLVKSGYRHQVQTARLGWTLGSLGFPIGVLVLAAALFPAALPCLSPVGSRQQKL